MKFKVFINTWANFTENGVDGGEWLSLPMDGEELDEELAHIKAKKIKIFQKNVI